MQCHLPRSVLLCAVLLCAVLLCAVLLHEGFVTKVG